MAGVLACPLAGAEETAAPAPWRDTFTTRLEALALLQSLNAELLSHDSATLTLDHWCELHQLASPARIVAERVHDVEKPVTPEQRGILGVGATEPIRYRRVRLRCGEHVLSEADNWYVPGRLTAEMNQTLDTSDTPFGRVVQGLHFQRHTLSSTLLWSPLPEGWEMAPAAAPASAPRTRTSPAPMDSTGRARGSTSTPVRSSAVAPLQIPAQVLQHRAVLTLPDGTPFSEVVETYTSGVLGFPEPPSR